MSAEAPLRPRLLKDTSELSEMVMIGSGNETADGEREGGGGEEESRVACYIRGMRTAHGER